MKPNARNMQTSQSSQTQAPARITLNIGGQAPSNPSGSLPNIQLRHGGIALGAQGQALSLGQSTASDLQTPKYKTIQHLTEEEFTLIPRKKSIVVVRTVHNEEEEYYTLHEVLKINEKYCQLRDIENRSKHRIPWNQIFMLHPGAVTAGQPCVALFFDEQERIWTTSYYKAQVFDLGLVQNRPSKSNDAKYTVVFVSDLKDLGQREVAEILYRKGFNLQPSLSRLHGVENIPTLTTLIAAEPYAKVALALAKPDPLGTLSAERGKGKNVHGELDASKDAKSTPDPCDPLKSGDVNSAGGGGNGSNPGQVDSLSNPLASSTANLPLFAKLQLVNKNIAISKMKAHNLKAHDQVHDHDHAHDHAHDHGPKKSSTKNNPLPTSQDNVDDPSKGDWEDEWELNHILSLSASAPLSKFQPTTSQLQNLRNLSVISSFLGFEDENSVESNENIGLGAEQAQLHGGLAAIAESHQRSTERSFEYLQLHGTFAETTTSSLLEFFGSEDEVKALKDLPSYPPPPNKVHPGATPLLYLHPSVPLPTPKTLAAAAKVVRENEAQFSVEKANFSIRSMPLGRISYKAPYQSLVLASESFASNKLPYAATKGLWGHPFQSEPKPFGTTSTTASTPTSTSTISTSSQGPQKRPREQVETKTTRNHDMYRSASGLWLPKNKNIILKNQGVVVAPFSLPF